MIRSAVKCQAECPRPEGSAVTSESFQVSESQTFHFSPTFSSRISRTFSTPPELHAPRPARVRVHATRYGAKLGGPKDGRPARKRDSTRTLDKFWPKIAGTVRTARNFEFFLDLGNFHQSWTLKKKFIIFFSPN